MGSIPIGGFSATSKSSKPKVGFYYKRTTLPFDTTTLWSILRDPSLVLHGIYPEQRRRVQDKLRTGAQDMLRAGFKFRDGEIYFNALAPTRPPLTRIPRFIKSPHHQV